MDPTIKIVQYKCNGYEFLTDSTVRQLAYLELAKLDLQDAVVFTRWSDWKQESIGSLRSFEIYVFQTEYDLESFVKLIGA